MQLELYHLHRVGASHPQLLKSLVLAAAFILNIPITPSQLTTMSTDTSRPRPRTSSVVAALIDTYAANLEASGIALLEHHKELLTDFLTTLVTCDSPSETILPPGELLTTSTPRSIHVGTGLTVTQNLATAISAAEHSVLFSTCFWAESESREVLADALRELSRCAEEEGRKVLVRIGFSSSSATQKLFHTSSPKGKTHLPSTWTTLGLPGPEELRGLDLRVKSIFFLPFSVLHSKFCIIDNRTLFLPSANISWETWLEQCTTFTGAVVDVFTSFWTRVWGEGDEPPFPSTMKENGGVPTIFLPHPHHRNPAFSPSLVPCFPSSSPRNQPPVTPQNTFFIHALTRAAKSIYIQTPNLNSQPLLRTLEEALARGVNVKIVTCRRMMVAEQMVTTAASASTEGCIRSLIRYDHHLRQNQAQDPFRGNRKPPGLLSVWYYTGAGSAEPIARQIVVPECTAAVKSHVKALIVDGEITVLGSANGDRASWFTSQEVNVAVFDATFAGEVREALVSGLGGRLERVAGVATKLSEIEE